MELNNKLIRVQTAAYILFIIENRKSKKKKFITF